MQILGKVHDWHVTFKNGVYALCQITAGFLIIAGAAILGLIAALFAQSWGVEIAVAVATSIPVWLGWNLAANALPALTRRFTDAAGTGRMGKLKDLKEAHLTKDERPGEGIYCGKFKGRVPVFYNGDRHIITVGPTRKGKDTGLLVPNLAHLNRRSVFVIDPKGELAAITANYRRKLGPVVIINPFGVLGLRSDGFNPLADPSFHPDSSSFFATAMSHGEAAIRHDPHGPHWTESGRGLFACVEMRAKWFQKEGKGPATMGQVNAMLSAPHTSPDEKVITLQKIMQEISQHHDEQMARLAARFIPDNKEVLSVIATVLGQTKFLNDRTLVADMEKHPTIGGKPFSFEMMKQQVITVYVILPDDMILTHAVWLRMVIASALNSLKRSGPGPVRPVLMLNEVGNLGRLEPLESAMGMAAGKGITIWLILQSLAQMTAIYGPHGSEAFMSGAAVFNSFGANDQETADYISRRLGTRSEIVQSYNTDLKGDISKNKAISGFPLMHPLDVMQLKHRKLLSTIEPSSVPFELDAPGYFDWIKGMDANPYYERRA